MKNRQIPLLYNTSKRNCSFFIKGGKLIEQKIYISRKGSPIDIAFWFIFNIPIVILEILPIPKRVFFLFLAKLVPILFTRESVDLFRIVNPKILLNLNYNSKWNTLSYFSRICILFYFYSPGPYKVVW